MTGNSLREIYYWSWIKLLYNTILTYTNYNFIIVNNNTNETVGEGVNTNRVV